MKKTVICGAVVMAVMAMGCTPKQENDGLCRIHGVANERLNDKKIFLVPMEGPATMETVDSVVIKDGKFEFESECGEMKVIRMDYRHRSGVEDLLVVMEPGDVEVLIDSVSCGKGTAQNDSLQGWKEYTRSHNRSLAPYRIRLREAKKAGDKATAAAAQVQLDSLQREYRRHSRKLAANLQEGAFRRFLETRFPTNYKKQMPDGTIETVPWD